MRAVAMKLHTKEQAPKEGGIEVPKPVKAVRGMHVQLQTANGVHDSAGLGPAYSATAAAGPCACKLLAAYTLTCSAWAFLQILIYNLRVSFCCLQWAPTQQGYLQFLAESEVVYNAFESIMQEASHPECECPAGTTSSKQQEVEN
jgi:hypothetical protein